MKSNEIRSSFLDFFNNQQHQKVPSSPLVSGNDATLLFTNSGMVQFKDVFLGTDLRSYHRAVTAQRCLRAGGKHNDLENVGFTLRHHTFFEMLGNFSFGDYFKREAIRFAWNLLTEVWKLDSSRLWVTVYYEDDEAFKLWRQDIGVPEDRCIRIGDKGGRNQSDNFWQMADTGPCGPCSEIFFDHGPVLEGGPPGSANADGDRYVEIWNLVFMQFNRDAQGILHPLPRPSVDTGMGLERVSAVLQKVISNYDIDLFSAITEAVVRTTKTREKSSHPSVRVIADHIRAMSFLITDGVLPDNEGRGYVLRRLIRRAALHGHKLGCTHPFLSHLVEVVVEQMGGAYPEVVEAAQRVKQTIAAEEERFAQTLARGLALLENTMPKAGGVLPGAVAFLLYDTHGFPLDLTADICKERNVSVDMQGFEEAMKAQKERARVGANFHASYQAQYHGPATRFNGYSKLADTSEVLFLFKTNGGANEEVSLLNPGDEAVVVLAQTPFYAESGGQVGDRGLICGPHGEFNVVDTQRMAGAIAHRGRQVKGTLAVSEKVDAKVDETLRHQTARNHSVTHLMHKALRQVLGEHVHQRGSLVDEHHTRFDFSHDAVLSAQQMCRIEELVNAEILQNSATQARVMPKDEALRSGAMALFGEKYDDEVRVLDIGSSRELCGGTHVARTGDIGLFKITAQESVAAGIRRVEAATGIPAMKWVQAQERHLREVSEVLQSPMTDAAKRVSQMQAQVRSLEKEVVGLKQRFAVSQTNDLLAQAQTIKGMKVLVHSVEGMDAQTLRKSVDVLVDKLNPAGVVVLTSIIDGKVNLIVGVSKDLAGRLSARDIAQHVASLIGGKAGGRNDLAQGGGTDGRALPEALASARRWVEARLG